MMCIRTINVLLTTWKMEERCQNYPTFRCMKLKSQVPGSAPIFGPCRPITITPRSEELWRLWIKRKIIYKWFPVTAGLSRKGHPIKFSEDPTRKSPGIIKFNHSNIKSQKKTPTGHQTGGKVSTQSLLWLGASLHQVSVVTEMKVQ